MSAVASGLGILMGTMSNADAQPFQVSVTIYQRCQTGYYDRVDPDMHCGARGDVELREMNVGATCQLHQRVGWARPTELDRKTEDKGCGGMERGKEELVAR